MRKLEAANHVPSQTRGIQNSSGHKLEWFITVDQTRVSILILIGCFEVQK